MNHHPPLLKKTSSSFDHSLIALGDFNNDRIGDPLYQALTSTGLSTPADLNAVPRTIFAQPNQPELDKHYDQNAGLKAIKESTNCPSDTGAVSSSTFATWSCSHCQTSPFPGASQIIFLYGPSSPSESVLSKFQRRIQNRQAAFFWR